MAELALLLESVGEELIGGKLANCGSMEALGAELGSRTEAAASTPLLEESPSSEEKARGVEGNAATSTVSVADDGSAKTTGLLDAFARWRALAAPGSVADQI